jgi:hypothetical protein
MGASIHKEEYDVRILLHFHSFWKIMACLSQLD